MTLMMGWVNDNVYDSGEANPDWKDYDHDDKNADIAGTNNADDDYDADAYRYVDASINDGCRQQWRLCH